MSQSNKILVSGCGFSWSGQEKKTWVNVLKSIGCDITDVGGPAVSNQWIINKAFTSLLSEKYNHVIIQLTSLGKLDVEVDEQRIQELVNADSLRNFTVGNVWPSSHSKEHESKRLYNRWLSSPGLEVEELSCKLIMLDDWCARRGIPLIVLQGYTIPWKLPQAKSILYNKEPLYDLYQHSSLYQFHDHDNQNTVPCLQYHLSLAETITKVVQPNLADRVAKIQQYFG